MWAGRLNPRRRHKPKVEAAGPTRQLPAVDFDAGDARVKVDRLDAQPVLRRASLEPDLGRPVDKVVRAFHKLPRALEPVKERNKAVSNTTAGI